MNWIEYWTYGAVLIIKSKLGQCTVLLKTILKNTFGQLNLNRDTGWRGVYFTVYINKGESLLTIKSG